MRRRLIAGLSLALWIGISAVGPVSAAPVPVNALDTGSDSYELGDRQRAREAEHRKKEIRFRKSIGFRYDDAYLDSLRGRPDVNMNWSVRLTAEESAEVDRRNGLASRFSKVMVWLRQHPEISGGAYIDHLAGGAFVANITDDATAEDRAELEALVPDGDDPFEIRVVEHTLATLEEIQEAVNDRTAADDPALDGIRGYGYSEILNRIEVDVDQERLQAVRAEFERSYGADLFEFFAIPPRPDGLPDTATEAAIVPPASGEMIPAGLVLAAAAGAGVWFSRRQHQPAHRQSMENK